MYTITIDGWVYQPTENDNFSEHTHTHAQKTVCVPRQDFF